MDNLRLIQAIKACLDDLAHEAYEAGLQEVGMLSATAALAAAEAVENLQTRMLSEPGQEASLVN